MNKGYFRFLFRSNRISLLFFAVLYALISFTSLISQNKFSSALLSGYVMSLILACVLPVYLFSWVHNRKRVDLFASLPYSRKNILFSSLAMAVLVPIVYFLVIGAVLSLMDRSHTLWPMYGTLMGHLIFYTVCIVLFHTAVYLIANNMLDGIILLVSYTLMPVLITYSVMFFLEAMSPLSFSGTADIYQFFPLPSAIMDAVRTGSRFASEDYYGSTYSVSLLKILPAAILSAWSLIPDFVHRKMERAEQLSAGFFAYPFVINVYAAGVMLAICVSFHTDSNAVILILMALFAVYMIAQFIYRRSIRPTVKMILNFVICLAACACMTFITWKTECFHTADHIAPRDRYLQFTYYGSIKENDGNNVSFSLLIDRNDSDQKEVLDLLNSYTDEITDAFYHSSQSQNNSYHDMTINASNKNDDETMRTVYNSFACGRLLSTDELEKISQYTDVTVDYYDESGNLQQEIPLNQFLKENKNEKS